LSLKSSKRNDELGTAGFVALGRLVKTYGVRGELRFLPYAFPCPTLRKGLVVQLQDTNGECRSVVVEKIRLHEPFVRITFQGISSRDQAHALRDMIVAVEEHQLPPLQDGEFYYYQVIGLTVLTTSGEEIGTIEQVFFSGGHDVWVVQKGKAEYMIPVTAEIVKNIDILGKRAMIEPVDGLLA